jgi:hypothetical protein
VNTTERATRFALSGAFALIAVLMDYIAKDVKFDIAIHGADERLDNYAQFVSLTWIFVFIAVVAFAWSFEAILAKKEKDEWLQEQVEADEIKFNDTW